MRLPAQRQVLANGLTLEPVELSYGNWHYHVLKHPLGLHRATMPGGKPAPWNRDGWTDTTPPVVEASYRDTLLAAIATLSDTHGTRCGVPEVHGKRAPSAVERYACESCPSSIAGPCASVLHDRYPVGNRYAAATQALLGALSDAVIVSRRACFAALTTAISRSGLDALRALSVLSVGATGRAGDLRAMARISGGSGIRAEFYKNHSSLVWRTCYRKRLPGAPALVSFLADFMAPVSGSLSENCLVPRHWWEQHGT